jgi:hypothetical protein
MANVGGFFRKVAPWVAAAAASAVPGPVGMAAKLVSSIIGKPVPEDPEQIDKAVQGMTPEQITQLQSENHQFEETMRKMGFDHEEALEKIMADDRANARARQIALKDRVPAILAMAVTVGFFGLLFLMLKFPPPAQNEKLLDIMIGSLGAAWLAIITFYFGSSAGSEHKNEIIANLTK